MVVLELFVVPVCDEPLEEPAVLEVLEVPEPEVEEPDAAELEEELALEFDVVPELEEDEDVFEVPCSLFQLSRIWLKSTV